MKRNYLMTLATVAMCLLTTPVLADDAKITKTTDPSGTFFWTQDFGQGETDNWLVLDTDGDKLTGSYMSGGQTVALKDGKYEDGKFSFTLALSVDGTDIEVKTHGGVKGDKMSAVSEVNLEGNTQEFDLEAVRKTRPEDVVGTWNLTIDAEGQTFEPVAKISKDGDNLVVEYLTDEFGDHKAVDVKLADNKLTYTIAVESPEGGLKLIFDTTPRGSKVSGKVEYEVGDVTGSSEVEGKREAPPADIVGTWNLTADAEGQTFEPVMKVTRKDGKLEVEYLTDEFGDHKAKDVKLDGDKLTFLIDVESPDGAMKLNFDTKIDGDKIAGKVEYQVGDVTGTTEIEGKKEAK